MGYEFRRSCNRYEGVCKWRTVGTSERGSYPAEPGASLFMKFRCLLFAAVWPGRCRELTSRLFIRVPLAVWINHARHGCSLQKVARQPTDAGRRAARAKTLGFLLSPASLGRALKISSKLRASRDPSKASSLSWFYFSRDLHRPRFCEPRIKINYSIPASREIRSRERPITGVGGFD